MKTKILTISLAFALTLLGCEKEKDLFVGEDIADLKAAKIKVMPSTKTNSLEKAMEDWQNINQAKLVLQIKSNGCRFAIGVD